MVYLTDADLRSHITQQSIEQSFNDLENPNEAKNQLEREAIDTVFGKISQKYDLAWEVKKRPIETIISTYPTVIYPGQRFIKDNILKVGKYDVTQFYNSTKLYKTGDLIFVPDNKIFRCVLDSPFYSQQTLINVNGNVVTPTLELLPFNQQFTLDSLLQYTDATPETTPQFFIADDRNPTIVRYITSIFIFYMCDRVMRIEMPQGIKAKYDATMSSLNNVMKNNNEVIFGLLNQQPVQEKIITTYAFPKGKNW